MILVCTPLGFVRLFDVVGQFLVKPQFLRDINEEFYACSLEEECLRQKLLQVQHSRKPYPSLSSTSLDGYSALRNENDDILYSTDLKSGESPTKLGSLLTNLETKRKLLGMLNNTILCYFTTSFV